MEYFKTARDIFKFVNNSVRDVSKGAIQLDKIGASLGKRALTKIGGVAKNKFGQIIQRRQQKLGRAKRMIRQGAQLFSQAPQVLQTSQEVLNQLHGALNTSDFSNNDFVQQLSNFAAQGSSALGEALTRHQQLQENLNPNALKMRTEMYLDRYLPQEDETLGSINRNVREHINRLSFAF